MIDDFRGPYRWLSNFHLCVVEYQGLDYPSTEHAFQAAKCTNMHEVMAIRAAPTCGAAKRMAGPGGIITLRHDWEQVKDQVMYEVCLDKFTRHADLREKLLATGDEALVEGNTWGDTYWGVCRGKGANKLGEILMRIRREIRGAL